MINELFFIIFDKKDSIGISTIISIFSLILSGIVFWMSNRQFILSNQGYLDIVPNLSFTAPQNNSAVSRPFIDDSSQIEGLNFSVLLKNVGNIPFLYNVTKYTTFLDNVENKLEDNAHTKGILYPRQELSFSLKTRPLNIDGSPIDFKILKTILISCLVEIEYRDLKGYTQAKYIKREFNWEIFDNIGKYSYIKFEDSL